MKWHEVVTGTFLILVPIGFNVAFLSLGRTFDYPDILRRPTDEILRRFHAGGTALILRWELLLLSAIAMLPLVATLSVTLAAPGGVAEAAIIFGIAAALTQAIGLVRWPFAVPELARRWVAADDLEPAQAAVARQSIDTTFVTMHRLLGVGIGEHLGYLFTGLWTLATAWSIVTGAKMPHWLGWVAIPIGLAMVVGSLEFAGRNERGGWPLAGRIVPIAYIAWSIWLIALGIELILNP